MVFGTTLACNICKACSRTSKTGRPVLTRLIGSKFFQGVPNTVVLALLSFVDAVATTTEQVKDL